VINGPSSPPLRAVLTALVLALGSFCGAARADIVQKDGKVHVTYWEKWVSFEGIAMQATIDAFNRTHPNIVVEYYPTSQIDRKTLVATAGGDPPDVAGLWVQNIATFADAEALLPLDPFIRRDGLTNEQWLARYYPIFARICQYRGHVYAGISTPAVIGFAWNRTLFRAAGLDPDRPPRDLAELADYSKRLTRRDAAWEFIKYCNSNNPKAQSREELEGSELACFLQAKTSPLRVWSPYFEQHHPNRFAGIFRELSASPHAVCVPQMGIWQEYHREFTAAFQQVRILGQTPEEAARYCQERMSRSWERYLRSLQRHGQGAPTDRPAAAPAAGTGEPSAPAPAVSATP
jgi:maltose-binding protein MalE